MDPSKIDCFLLLGEHGKSRLAGINGVLCVQDLVDCALGNTVIAVEVAEVDDGAVEALAGVQGVSTEGFDLIEGRKFVDDLFVFLLGGEDEGGDAEGIAGGALAVFAFEKALNEVEVVVLGGNVQRGHTVEQSGIDFCTSL